MSLFDLFLLAGTIVLLFVFLPLFFELLPIAAALALMALTVFAIIAVGWVGLELASNRQFWIVITVFGFIGTLCYAVYKVNIWASSTSRAEQKGFQYIAATSIVGLRVLSSIGINLFIGFTIYFGIVAFFFIPIGFGFSVLTYLALDLIFNEEQSILLSIPSFFIPFWFAKKFLKNGIVELWLKINTVPKMLQKENLAAALRQSSQQK